MRQGGSRIRATSKSTTELNWDAGEKFWWRGFDSEKLYTALAVLAFVFITAVWGSTFFLIKNIVGVLPPLDFLGLRFAIAAIIIVILRFRSLKRVSWDIWEKGLILGAIFALGQLFQTIGLQYTDASVSGFITGMYVVLTPIALLVLFGVRVSRSTWAFIMVATAGLMVLTLDGFSIGLGEFLTFLGAVMFTLHIVIIGRWATKENVLDLGVIQVIGTGLFSFAVAVPGGITLPSTSGQWASVLYMAIVASLLALLLQTWAQARIKPTSTAIILTLEPLFAAGFAVAYGGEVITTRLIIGGLLIIVAMSGAELVPPRMAKRKQERLVKA